MNPLLFRKLWALLLAAGAVSLLAWVWGPAQWPFPLRAGLWLLSTAATGALLVWFFFGALPEESSLPREEASAQGAAASGPLISAILDSLREGILVVDDRQHILHCNRAASRWMNRSREEAVDLPLWEVLRHRQIEDMVGRVLATGQEQSKELSLSFPSETSWLVGVRPFDRQGRGPGAIITLSDVSHVRRLENMRKDFVANVSHELRTPLTALRAALETLLEGALEDRRNARDFLETAQIQVERLQRLIDDLLTLSRLDHFDPTTSPVGRAALQDVAEKVLKVLEPMAQRHDVRLQAQWPQTPVNVALLPDQVAQIFTNLLDNAIKFNRPGGQVEVACRLQDRTVEVSVKDTGSGILAEDLPRIFERFYRVDKARSRELGGTGLGLSIVKHIVENSGGRIEVQSTPDQGSDFRVTLPLAD